MTTIIVVAAVAVALAGVLLPPVRLVGDGLSTLAAAGVATALAAAGQFARLRFRLGRGAVSVSWAEAAFMLGAVLAPAGWLPAATLVGAAGAWLLISWLNEHRPTVEILHLAASLSLGAAAGSAVLRAVAGSAVGPSRVQLAMVAGAFAYLMVTFPLATATLALHRDAPLRQIVARVFHAKIPMFAGNLLVGLLGAYVLLREPLWLLAFGPLLWLLQRTYRYHLLADAEQRTWVAFARATAALPGAGEDEVAAAGLRGALDVFGARRVEIEVLRPDGTVHRYMRDAPGSDVDASGLPGPVITRAMEVAGVPVGELTVWFAEPSVPALRDELTVSAYADALAGALHDAASRVRLAALDARSSHEAEHDPVTGLLNRATLFADGDRVLRSLDREHQVAVLLLDLKGFREVNRTLGHRSGDTVLAVIAGRIADLSREREVVARLGDDEFAVLMPNLVALTDSSALGEAPSPLRQAVRRARELVEDIGAPMEVAGVRLAVESAAGVAVCMAGGVDTAELVRRASIALEDAQRARQNVGAYDSARDVSSTDHLAMPAELQDALAAGDQIVLALQPAVDLITGAPTGVEALTRWRHPRRGMLSPAVFIPAIEESELLGPFTRYVLDLSLAAAGDWMAQGFNLPVSVNISARSLLDRGFPDLVGELLRRRRIPAHRLVLEITESIALSEQEVVDEVLAALREMGVQLSLDDFGTGFSSLSSVIRTAVDELKIDRSFVEEIIESPAAAAVVRGAVELGDRLGARVVAEGVETAEQRAALLAAGCTTAQGYHFCQPLPTDKIVAALRQLSDTAPARLLPLRADDAV